MYDRATKARQQFAQELFDTIAAITDPNLKIAVQGDPLFDQARRVAQPAVNIVDYIDVDDYMTPFAWHKPDPTTPARPANPTTWWQWVYGNELPRLVVNEVYADIRNTEKDEDDNKITQPYQVKFWIELNNPLFRANLSQPGGPQNIGNEPTGQRDTAGRLTENGSARLRVLKHPDPSTVAGGNRWESEWSCYNIQICLKNDPNDPAAPDLMTRLADPANTAGDLTDPMTTGPSPLIKTQVTKFDWDYTAVYPGPMMTPDKPNLVKLTEGDMMAMPAIQPYEPVRDAINVVEPMNGYGIGPEEDNFGFYVIGPTSPAQFGMGGSGKKPTMKIRDERPSSMPGMPAEGLTYEIPQSDPLVKDPKMLGQLPEHVVVLRHLCCPAMKPDSSPTMTDGRPNPLYNPYVTVDVMENVKIWDRGET